MILGRNLNRIGYTSKVIGPKTKDVSIFAETVLGLVSENQERGISVTCIEVEQGFHPLDFSVIEDGSQESDVIWEVFQFLKSNRHRLFFFLPSYYFLGSQIPEVVTGTKEVLKSLSVFLDQVGVRETSIILRIGSAYGARKSTMERFCDVIEGLESSIGEKLSVCNDEKPSLFSVTDLLSGIFYRIGIPIVFRFLPHQFNAGSLSTREAYFLAVSTWVKGKVPIFMHSESSEVDENGISLSPAPSDYLRHRIPTFGLEIDVIIDLPTGLNGCMHYLANSISFKPMVINKIGKK
jgi:hypothetical protein